MRGVAHDEDAVLLHVGGEAVVHRPGVGRDEVDFEVRDTDQLAGDLRCHRFVHNGGGLVDVVSPDDQPFVPGANHADKAHADAADIGAGLHDPVKD